MTFRLEDKYPERCVPSDSSLPRGKFKNRTSPTSLDGSYLEQEWANDDRAFPDTILKMAGVVPDGEVDYPGKSQVYESLMAIISGMISASTETLYAEATGSPNAMSATFKRAVKLKNGSFVYVRANGRNTSQAPTISVNNQPAKAVVKGNNQPLQVGDISGAGFVCELIFDERFDRWILLNPAYGVLQVEQTPLGTISWMGRKAPPSGWNLIDGREYQRSEYQEFLTQCPEFTVNGSTANTFKLIDLRGYFLRVLDNGRGIDSNRGFGSSQGDAIQNIKGTFAASNRENRGGTPSGAFQEVGVWSTEYKDGGGDGWGRKYSFDASRVVNTAGETRPKNIALPLYIKMK